MENENNEKLLTYNFGPTSDDGDDQDDSSNSDRNLRREPQQPRRKSTITLVVLILVLVALVVILIYFFVIKNPSNKLTFSENDIAYRVDYDGDKVDDEINPEYKLNDTVYDNQGNPKAATTYNTFSEVVMDIDKGEQNFLLSYLLMSPGRGIGEQSQFKDVSLVVQYSNKTSQLVILSGQFKHLNTDDNKWSSYKYTATLQVNDYDRYIKPIVFNTYFLNSKTSKFEKYFTTANGTYSGVDVQTENNIMSWLMPLIMIASVILIFVFLFKMSKGGEGQNPMAGFTNNLGKKQAKSKVKFSDVAGCDEVKQELAETIDYFTHADKFTKLGAKLPHGLLLIGPPGTGKTLLAKAVAGEANVPFFSISGSDFVEMYVGVGASRVRSLFKTAKQNAPCLIFIDEIDAVGRQRGTGLGGGNDEREQTLNELLVEMDGFEDNNGIVVIAATNRSDVLDPALTRPGRFDRTITVDLPDKEGRAAILKVHSRNKIISSEVNFDNIASRTVGFAGADLANIMNEAAILAVRNNRSAITTQDIDEAIDRAIAGPAKKSHMEADEKKQVAYHESGHAVVGLFLPYSDKVQKITIIPRGRTGGHVLMTPEKDRFLMTKNQLLARITGYLGGRTSEEIFFGDVSTGASNDIEVATNIARSMVTEYGMSSLGPIQYEKSGGNVFLGRDYTSSQANYSTQIAYEIDKEIRSIIEDCHKQCKDLLLKHKDDIELIANTLIERETITADEIAYLLKNRKMPEVDECKEVQIDCLNPNHVTLIPSLAIHYKAIDKVMKRNPTRVIIVVSKDSGTPITYDEFIDKIKQDSSDLSNVGIYFVDEKIASSLEMSIDDFASHIREYTKADTLLLVTNEVSLKNVKENLTKKPKSDVKDESNNDKIISDKKEDSSKGDK